jgi:pyruvate-formate lyase
MCNFGFCNLSLIPVRAKESHSSEMVNQLLFGETFEILETLNEFVLIRGTLLNQKFTPSFFNDNESIARLTHLIRGYFRLDGHHVQFNVVSAKTLKEAQKNPEKYRDLIVRVAGYSDYFNDLSTDLQNEIIRRTEHSEAH